MLLLRGLLNVSPDLVFELLDVDAPSDLPRLDAQHAVHLKRVVHEVVRLRADRESLRQSLSHESATLREAAEQGLSESARLDRGR